MFLFSALSHISRPMSKAESHFSARTSRRGPASIIRTDYMSQDEEPTPTFMYPHLQVMEIQRYSILCIVFYIVRLLVTKRKNA